MESIYMACAIEPMFHTDDLDTLKALSFRPFGLEPPQMDPRWTSDNEKKKILLVDNVSESEIENDKIYGVSSQETVLADSAEGLISSVGFLCVGSQPVMLFRKEV